MEILILQTNIHYTVIALQLLIMIYPALVTAPARDSGLLVLGDPNTGWQEDVVTNIGFESVFWNGKLSINVDLV